MTWKPRDITLAHLGTFGTVLPNSLKGSQWMRENLPDLMRKAEAAGLVVVW